MSEQPGLLNTTTYRTTCKFYRITEDTDLSKEEGRAVKTNILNSFKTEKKHFFFFFFKTLLEEINENNNSKKKIGKKQQNKRLSAQIIVTLEIDLLEIMKSKEQKQNILLFVLFITFLFIYFYRDND